MALKKQFEMSATFSMASMTDVIFLLLIFFMVTSTFVFPNALEVNLPESSIKTTLKPSARVYIDAEGRIISMMGEENAEVYEHVDFESLRTFFVVLNTQAMEDAGLLVDEPAEDEAATDAAAPEVIPPLAFVALYADKEVPYGSIVEVLNMGAENNVKVVLATTVPDSLPSVVEETQPTIVETDVQ